MKILSLILVPLLIGFSLLHPADAVAPPPDGGYPNLNTAEGQKALFSLTSGAANTAIGWYSLKSDTTGSYNTGIGAGTLTLNSGDENTAVGTAALLLSSGGSDNTAIGSRALINNSAGSSNTACGQGALLFNTTGGSNTAIGVSALQTNSDGGENVAVGYAALFDNSSSQENVAVGVFAGSFVRTANNVICLGSNVSGADVDNSCYIGNIWTQPGGSQAVFVDANGKLGAQVSSRRFKEQIKQMDDASRALFALTPVSFRYKKEIDPTGKAQFGLVAEDVAKVNPNLVILDKEGKPYTVRYDQVNAMLLNEFLKEHKKVEQQEQSIARLEKELESVTATLQKVSAQLELNKPAPQTVKNND